MAAKTIHGWDVIPAASDDRLKEFTIPGTRRKMRLRKDVGPYLVAFASEYHKQIADLDDGTFDDWAWCALRDGRASTKPSDHCGGVAVDLNATGEGAQSKSNVTWWKNPIRAKRLAALRKKYDLLEWGGSYRNFYDPMHWTYKPGVTVREVQQQMKRLGIKADGSLA